MNGSSIKSHLIFYLGYSDVVMDVMNDIDISRLQSHSTIKTIIGIILGL